MSVDPYVDPDSGVLRNLLGITSPETLRAAESGLTYAAIADLGVRLLPGSYDLTHLQTFHREIFRDIYEWVGEIRTVNLAKTDLFCAHQHIESCAGEMFAGLAKEDHLRGLRRDVFIERLTHYLAEVNAIHPFREGNGRAQRAFFHQLCRVAGWPINWSGLEPQANDAACMMSLNTGRAARWYVPQARRPSTAPETQAESGRGGSLQWRGS